MKTITKKRQPISAQVKKGLARAFTKFNEYELAKYNQNSSIKLRDVLFLTHPRPKDQEQQNLWNRLVNNELKTPDTWEVELSASKDKKASWTRLLSENKLGALALIRNLRNYQENGVDDSLIRNALKQCNPHRVLPFRFIAAAKYAPKFEPELEALMFKCVENHQKLNGRTVLLVDSSRSMKHPLSSKSDLTRLDAANGLAMLLREMSNTDIYTFSRQVVNVPARRGFGLRDAIVNSQPHLATILKPAIELISGRYDRCLIITDEQNEDGSISHLQPAKKNYLINVSTEKHGIGYGSWVHLEGMSENLITFILELENFDPN